MEFENQLGNYEPIPLNEMLSNDQYSSEIKHLLQLINLLAKTSTKYMQRRVEMDFSWAILNAVLVAFNKDVLKYLN